VGIRHKADTDEQTVWTASVLTSVRFQLYADLHEAWYQTAFRAGDDLYVGLAYTVLSRYGVYEQLCCYASIRAYLLDGRDV